MQLEKWWGNIFGPFYKILLIHKCLFFIFCNMCYSGVIGKDWFKLKASIKFLNFQNSILGLKFEYIFSITCHSKTAWWFQVNESVCIAKFEQQCDNNYQNIWKRTQILVVRWRNITCQFYSNTFNDCCTLKAQALKSHLLCFFVKFFLSSAQSVYQVSSIYNSLILI